MIISTTKNNKALNMFKNGLRIFLFSLLLVTSLAHAHHIDLFKGDMQVLKLGPIKRVAVGDGKMISTSIIEDGQLLILAEDVGETQLRIWMKSGSVRVYKVRVSENDVSRESAEIRSLTKSLPGVTQRKVGEKIILEGVVDEKGKELITQVKELYKNMVDLTKPAQVSAEKMIYMKVQITEFNTSKLSQLGISWQNAINGPSAGVVAETMTGGGVSVVDNLPTTGGISLPTTGAPTNARNSFGYFGIGTGIRSTINLAKSNGDALILAEPILSARSGGEAEFLSGGEVPLPSTSSLGSSEVEFKEFGIKLKFKPLADERGNIVARVEAELSTIDQSLAVNNIPGFRTRKAATDVTLKSGETVVISRLMNSEMAQDRSRLAGLGDIPVLGRLFRSTNFRNSNSELVIFVTPEIIDTTSSVNAEAQEHAEKLRETFFENIKKNKRILD